ncbi:hypothetical protein Cylst_4822 [Cylindrospermum stagnale PCC 7417]|uniref:Uncharacterized protein n=1 Tax=Cylindrospermum stagnale PCC 7417 TaxID=56107 RepID=K9X331_9NOST|nr:hypothetical protein [Cylindrospermum stagnale]AFZ26878.1 hypothetical protein Cylst_4822 [Cylindrospermum stagnale PCC 7417]
MNRKFILALLSSPVVFMSMLSMVMMARPVHASEINPAGTHLSCARSPHRANAGKVCIRVSNSAPSPAKAEVQVALVQPNEIAELEFTEEESNEAINLFGCDCPPCLNAVRKMRGLAPMPV